MIFKYIPSILLLAILLCCRAATADLRSDLQDYVNQIGGAVNTTDPSLHQGQGRGYLNGGRLYLRVPSRNVQLASFRAPNYRAGCGGIDIFGGGFTLIDTDALINTLQQIGSNAAGYAFMLGLRTVSSQIANTIEQSFDWMQQFNNMNLSTCQAAAVAVDQVYSGFSNTREESICIMRRMETSADTYEEAKARCTAAGGGRNAVINDDAVRQREFLDGNLIWQLMRERNMYGNDEEVQRMVMTLTGTIVRQKVNDAGLPADGDEDATTRTLSYPSLLLDGDSELLSGLLEGGTVQIYTCEDSTTTYGCRQLNTEDVDISTDESFRGRAWDALQDLLDDIENRNDPDDADFQYVANTTLPVQRILAVAASIGGPVGDSLIQRYVDAVAVNMLDTYLRSLIEGARAYTIKPNLGPDGDLFRDSLQYVLTHLEKRKQEIDRTLGQTITLAQELQHYENVVLSALPRGLGMNYQWGRR